MRIIFTKISGTHHTLEIIRDTKKREQVELETKTFLMHDLMHYAIESIAGTSDGIWGALAAGKTMADMNDRTGEALKEYAPDMSIIELIVGAFTPVIMGRSDGTELIAGMNNMLSAQGKSVPRWLNDRFIAQMQERMRQLLGEWRSTRFGEKMELPWK